MFRSPFKYLGFLDPFYLARRLTLYIDGPDVEQPAPINQGEARRDFLEAEIDLAPEVLEAQQLFGPDFAQSDFDVLLNTILGTSPLSDFNRREEALLSQIKNQEDILAAPDKGRGFRVEQKRAKERAQIRLEELNSELSELQNEPRPTSDERVGGLAELLGGTGIGEAARIEGLLDALSRAESSANTLRRDADISDVESFATRFGSDEDIDRLRTGELNRALDRIEELNSTTDTPIGTELRSQALEGLGEGLTDRERREIQQAVRVGAEARGRVNDPVAILDEAEATVLADRNRLNQNRAFAQNVDATDLNKLLNDRGFALNTAQAAQGAGFDPFAAILGRSSGAPGIAQAQIGNAFPFVQGTPSFDTTGGLDIALGNQANQAAFNSALAGANATRLGAGLGAIGSLGGQLAQGIGSAGGMGKFFNFRGEP